MSISVRPLAGIVPAMDNALAAMKSRLEKRIVQPLCVGWNLVDAIRSHKTLNHEHAVQFLSTIRQLAALSGNVYMQDMKVKDAEILIVPGYTNSGPDHWQSRWEENLSSARRVEQAEWSKPVRDDWVGELAKAVNAAERPVVLVAHSLGVPTVINAVPHFQKKVAGAFLVAPPDVANPAIRPKHLMTFGPYPRDPLPFPSIVIGSRNDPFCDYEVAEDYAAAWGSLFIDAGEAGHINADAGFGPWPEGSMVFAQFLSRL